MAYNGWSNYETWVVKLWIDNEQGSYEDWRGRTRAACKNADDKDEATGTLSHELKSEIEDASPLESGMYADLLNAALSEVDWMEIASAMVEDEEWEWGEEEEKAGESHA
jgi:hypothetical protein